MRETREEVFESFFGGVGSDVLIGGYCLGKKFDVVDYRND